MNSSRFQPRAATRRSWVPFLIGACVVTLFIATAAGTAAQAPEGVYRISQRASVSQNLGNAVISLDYSRPLTRDRNELFGQVVHWGELWTPGANEATVLEVSEEVKLNGHTVPEGRWSMWIIPSRVGPWELVLDARDTLFHTQRPELTDDQIRFIVDVDGNAPHVEALTWAFPRIANDGATLRMDWGTTRIDLAVEVRPTKPDLTVSATVAALYAGDWAVTFHENPETGHTLPPTVLSVRHAEDGSLMASFPPGSFAPPEGSGPDTPVDEAAMTPQERERAEARRLLASPPEGAFDFVLVPRARGVFLFGWVQDGELLDVEEFYHEFEFQGDRAVRLTIRDPKDRVFATAVRP
jgi:hypothetical protein